MNNETQRDAHAKRRFLMHQESQRVYRKVWTLIMTKGVKDREMLALSICQEIVLPQSCIFPHEDVSSSRQYTVQPYDCERGWSMHDTR